MAKPSLNNLESDKHVISCKLCKKKLLNIIVVAPSDTQNKIECNCPFCGGKSETVEIKGRLFQGPITKSESNYPTSLANMDIVEGVWKIEIVKI